MVAHPPSLQSAITQTRTANEHTLSRAHHTGQDTATYYYKHSPVTPVPFQGSSATASHGMPSRCKRMRGSTHPENSAWWRLYSSQVVETAQVHWCNYTPTLPTPSRLLALQFATPSFARQACVSKKTPESEIDPTSSNKAHRYLL